MASLANVSTARVQRLPTSRPTVVVDELNRLLMMLREACPPDAIISFDFDGQLHVHIDVRKREDVTIIENTLPSVGLGAFQALTLRSTPNRPFFHRVSALVAS